MLPKAHNCPELQDSPSLLANLLPQTRPQQLHRQVLEVVLAAVPEHLRDRAVAWSFSLSLGLEVREVLEDPGFVAQDGACDPERDPGDFEGEEGAGGALCCFYYVGLEGFLGICI